MVTKKKYTEEEKKLILLKRKKAKLKKKELLEKDADVYKEPVDLVLITHDEKLEISKELKLNAIASFARFSFYKDGYKKTLGILLFMMLTLSISIYALCYSAFIYKAPNAYLPVNEMRQLIEPASLADPLYTDKEIIDFASRGYKRINGYNYVNIDDDYFSNLTTFFTEKTLSDYRKAFLSTTERQYISKYNFIVSSIILKGAKIDKEETARLSKETGIKVWVVNLKSVKVYQNQSQFVKKPFTTTIKIFRVNYSSNERGIAIHTFVDEKTNEKKD